MTSSPLRYPGGKAKLYPYFVDLINANSLHCSEYCEPYAGGAGLAIRLLVNGFVEKISINDIDKSIFAFWKSALWDTENFCELIERTPITVAEWYKQKATWKALDFDNLLALGFSAYFLNRTNRSGIIDGAGPIGGYEQTGSWKIDARLVKDKQIHNILSLSKYRDQINVSNLDALDFIGASLDRKNTLTYLDPPYYVKGRKLYKNFYKPDDHHQIAQFLTKRRDAVWVVSYDDVEEIRKEYENFSPISYSLNYSAGPKMLGSEVIFLSDALIPPSSAGLMRAA